MISEETREWIRMYTEEFFPEEEIDKAIDRYCSVVNLRQKDR